MAAREIRLIGDPVLRTRSNEVTDVDAALARLCDEMFEAMYEVAGIGLAAPQVGVRQRFFVYDHGEDDGVIVNPEVVESDGEWAFDEGCLSVPDLSFEIVRPRRIHLVGIDLDGNEVSIEADELEARRPSGLGASCHSHFSFVRLNQSMCILIAEPHGFRIRTSSRRWT